MNRIAGATFPALAEPYAAALEAATAFVLERYAKTFGIIAAGTIIGGTPDPESDLDVYVVHAEPFCQRVQRRFCGVPTEIFVNNLASSRHFIGLDRIRGKCATAHMIATGTIVFEANPALRELCSLAAGEMGAPPKCEPSQDLLERYFAGGMQEDARDVVARDPQAAALILSHEVWAILEQRHRRAGRWIPRLKDLIRETQKLDPELGALARGFFRTADPGEQLTIVEKMSARIEAPRAFFEWESEPERDPAIVGE